METADDREYQGQRRIQAFKAQGYRMIIGVKVAYERYYTDRLNKLLSLICGVLSDS